LAQQNCTVCGGWLVNGAAKTMCTMKEYDKLNLTAAAQALPFTI